MPVVLPALLVSFTEQLGCEPDVVGEHDDLMVFSKRDDAITDLMDASVVHACYGVIKDHRRGRLFGNASTIPISVASLVMNLIQVPATFLLLSSGTAQENKAAFAPRASHHGLRQPVVWAAP